MGLALRSASSREIRYSSARVRSQKPISLSICVSRSSSRWLRFWSVSISARFSAAASRFSAMESSSACRSC